MSFFITIQFLFKCNTNKLSETVRKFTKMFRSFINAGLYLCHVETRFMFIAFVYDRIKLFAAKAVILICG